MLDPPLESLYSELNKRFVLLNYTFFSANNIFDVIHQNESTYKVKSLSKETCTLKEVVCPECLDTQTQEFQLRN